MKNKVVPSVPVVPVVLVAPVASVVPVVPAASPDQERSEAKTSPP